MNTYINGKQYSRNKFTFLFVFNLNFSCLFHSCAFIYYTILFNFLCSNDAKHLQSPDGTWYFLKEKSCQKYFFSPKLGSDSSITNKTHWKCFYEQVRCFVNFRFMKIFWSELWWFSNCDVPNENVFYLWFKMVPWLKIVSYP